MATKRRCQTGRVRPILVEEFDPPVKLLVRTTFRRLCDLTEEMHAIPDDDQAQSLPIMLGFLEESITDWEGVIGEDGQPRPFSKQALGELDMADIQLFIQAIQTGGDAGSGDPLPATASEATSGEPPAS